MRIREPVRTRKTGRRRSWLATPLASVVLLGALVVDGASLAHDSGVGGLIHDRFHTHGADCETLYPVRAYVERTGDGVTLRAYDHPVSHAFRNSQPGGDGVVAVLTADPNTEPRGVWAITSETFDHTVDVSLRDGPLDDATLAIARREFIDLARLEALTPEHAGLMRAGDGVTTRTRWLGWAHNAATIGVAMGLLASLRWVWRR